jgi:cytoskeletal protein RodZ
MASFGENLRRERELRGVELRDIADATKISVRFLQALEQDRVDVLPGGIFPRSFVRQYAKHLGLDPDRMATEFDHVYGREPVVPKSAGGSAHRRAEPRPWLVVAGLLLLAAVGFLAWKTSRPVSTAAGPEPSVAAPPPTSFPPDRVYPPPTPTPNAAPSAGEVQGLALVLTATQDCWTGTQADGIRVVDRVLKAGENVTINAQNEIVLSVGNAAGITFTLNGRPGVPLGREGEVRRNIVITRESMASLLQESPPAAVAR